VRECECVSAMTLVAGRMMHCILSSINGLFNIHLETTSCLVTLSPRCVVSAAFRGCDQQHFGALSVTTRAIELVSEFFCVCGVCGGD
jgi:hypothetical protein